MIQLTREQAIKIAESGVWKQWDDEKIVRIQLFQSRLCVPFERFHDALNAVLGRGVWTHELAESNIQNIIDEYHKLRSAPAMREIINLIPEHKRRVVVL